MGEHSLACLGCTSIPEKPRREEFTWMKQLRAASNQAFCCVWYTHDLLAWEGGLIEAQAQTPGRIQKVDPPILGSNTPMVEIIEPLGVSTFWIRPGVGELELS